MAEDEFDYNTDILIYEFNEDFDFGDVDVEFFEVESNLKQADYYTIQTIGNLKKYQQFLQIFTKNMDLFWGVI